jgi:acyl-CoA thioester hydrolase
VVFHVPGTSDSIARVPRTPLPQTPPPAAKTSTVRHRVPFYETDAMGIVHHANWVRYLELVRVVWLDEHDRPYRDYVAEGLHYATTSVDVRYHRSAAFDDEIEVTTWLEWVRGASLRMAYVLRRGEQLLATAATEHAMVDGSGRPTRIPRDRRESLARLAAWSHDEATMKAPGF